MYSKGAQPAQTTHPTTGSKGRPLSNNQKLLSGRHLHEVIIFALVVHADVVDSVAVKVATEHVRVRLEGERNPRQNKTHGGGVGELTRNGDWGVAAQSTASLHHRLAVAAACPPTALVTVLPQKPHKIHQASFLRARKMARAPVRNFQRQQRVSSTSTTTTAATILDQQRFGFPRYREHPQSPRTPRSASSTTDNKSIAPQPHTRAREQASSTLPRTYVHTTLPSSF